MATNTLAPFFVDGKPTIESGANLFAVEFDGLSLRMTPHAFCALINKGRAEYARWEHASRFRDERNIRQHPAQFGRKASS